jgi:hypothetical protein
LQLQFPDGTRRRVSDDQLADLCDQLWSLTPMRGSLALLGKLSHERHRVSVLQRPIEVDELEAAACLRALQELQGHEQS